METMDVMVRNVLAVNHDTIEVARLLVENDISAPPVVDDQGKSDEARRGRYRQAPALVA